MQHSLLEVSEVSFTPVPPGAMCAIPTLTEAGCRNTCCPLPQWLVKKPSAAPCTNGIGLGSYIVVWLHLLALYLLMVVTAVPVTAVLHVTHWHPLSIRTAVSASYGTGVIGAGHSQIADSIANLGFHLFPTRGKALSRQGRWTFQELFLNHPSGGWWVGKRQRVYSRLCSISQSIMKDLQAGAHNMKHSGTLTSLVLKPR